MSPETYTQVYDAIVTAIRRVDPQMKFVGSWRLGGTSASATYFEYFLNPKNHKPGIPLDMISYHFYASPSADQTPEVKQFTCWIRPPVSWMSVGFIQDIRRA